MANCLSEKFGVLVNFIALCLMIINIDLCVGYFVIEGPTPLFQPKNVCNTTACFDAAARLLKNMDPQAEPCNNFYRFACGKFVDESRIPNGKVQINKSSWIADHVQEQLIELLKEESPPNEVKAFKLSKDMFKACMDTAHIETIQVEPLKKILKKFGGWPVLEGNQWKEDDFHWTETVYKSRKLGYPVNNFLTVDLRWISGKPIITLDPATLLSNSYSASHDSQMREFYFKIMVKIAKKISPKVDIKQVERELHNSLKLEIAIAKAAPIPKFTVMTVDQLENTYKLISWQKYFSNIFNTTVDLNQTVFLHFPENYINNLEDILKRYVKRDQANYAIWRVVMSTIPFLNDKMRYDRGELMNSVLDTDRTQECYSVVSQRFPVIIRNLHASKFFDENKKSNVIEIVENIRKQTKVLMQKSTRMDDESKISIIKKVDNMSISIDDLNYLLNNSKFERYYEGLEFNENDYLGIILNYTSYIQRMYLNLNNSDLNTKIPPAYSDKIVDFKFLKFNRFDIPSNIVQDELFNVAYPKYINYGALGSIIGREMFYGIDLISQTDKRSSIKSSEHYRSKKQCIIHQYSKYRDAGLKLNITKTNVKDITDDSGIKAAYLAYIKWSSLFIEPEQKLPDLQSYDSKQMFWISAAGNLCTAYQNDYLKRIFSSGKETPAEFRVIESFSNIPEFAQDFQCQDETKMNPMERCDMW